MIGVIATESYALLLSLFMGITPLTLTPQQQQSTACPTGQINVNSVSFYHGAFKSGKCWLSYSKAMSASMNYRSVLFTDMGTMMVFNSFDGRYGVYHGSRVFMSFPRDQAPYFIEKNTGVVIKTATAGFDLFVSAQTKHIEKSKKATVTESLTVDPSNMGGIEISKNKFLMLDAGWKDHNDPTAYQDRESTFIDRKGKSCIVINKEIFYVDREGEHHFRFTDAELYQFLAQRCPHLKAK